MFRQQFFAIVNVMIGGCVVQHLSRMNIVRPEFDRFMIGGLHFGTVQRTFRTKVSWARVTTTFLPHSCDRQILSSFQFVNCFAIHHSELGRLAKEQISNGYVQLSMHAILHWLLLAFFVRCLRSSDTIYGSYRCVCIAHTEFHFGSIVVDDDDAVSFI